MPDLGRYAATVLSSYAVALVLLAGLALISIRRARAVRKALDDVEARVKRG